MQKQFARSAPLKKKHLQLAETRHIAKVMLALVLFNFFQVGRLVFLHQVLDLASVQPLTNPMPCRFA